MPVTTYCVLMQVKHIYVCIYIYVFFLVVLVFELRASCLLGSHLLLESLHQLFFYVEYFRDWVSWTIWPCWPQTEILLISASWLVRITGMSHWHLTTGGILLVKSNYFQGQKEFGEERSVALHFCKSQCLP
jgi:hypothetical protein